MIAAPYAGAIMGDLGAEVIKLEAPGGDALRQSALLSNTPFRFNEANRNKLGICLDLTKASGQSTFRKLVEVSDVVMTNLRPDVIGKLGLDYSTLRESNASIIAVRLSAFGATGPDALRRGTAPTIDAASGLTSVNGYPGGPPLRPGGYYPDLTAALFSVFSIMAALSFRDVHGEGQEIDVAMTESVAHVLGEAIMQTTLDESLPLRQGNGDQQTAPCDCYPCREPDTWVAISTETDDDWQKLRECMGNPEWAREDRFATADLRKKNESTIEAMIGTWTGSQSADTVVRLLREKGLPAALVSDASALLNDPQLVHRGFFRRGGSNSALEPLPRLAFPHLSGGDWPVLPAPGFGEHNTAIFRDLLHLDSIEIDHLYSDGGSYQEIQMQAVVD